MIQLKLCLTERNRKNSISSFYMDLIPNKNFICIIDTSIDVSNSSQKGSGDFLELSRKSDSSVINELLKPDLLAHPGSCAPFSAYLSNNSHTQQSHLKHHKALCPLHVAKHTGLTWNMLNLLNKLELQNVGKQRLHLFNEQWGLGKVIGYKPIREVSISVLPYIMSLEADRLCPLSMFFKNTYLKGPTLIFINIQHIPGALQSS